MPTQHSDIYNPTAPAIVYSKSGQTWKIANGVLVGSGTGAAVYSSAFNGIKLVNNGGVFDSLSPGGIGVSFQALKNGTVVNKAAPVSSAATASSWGTFPAPRT